MVLYYIIIRLNTSSAPIHDVVVSSFSSCTAQVHTVLSHRTFSTTIMRIASAAILSVALAALGSSSYSVDAFCVTMPVVERRSRYALTPASMVAATNNNAPISSSTATATASSSDTPSRPFLGPEFQNACGVAVTTLTQQLPNPALVGPLVHFMD